MEKSIDLLAAGSWAIFDHIFKFERIPDKGETVNILSPISEVDKLYWGGCSYNSAVAASKLGLKTGILAVEGKDFISKGYKDYLENLGVDLSGVVILNNEYSGHGFLFVDPEGNSIVLGNLGAAWKQKAYTPSRTLISAAKALVAAPTFDSFTLSACMTAKEAGLLVAVNGSLTTWPRFAKAFVRSVDILFSNQFEILKLLDLLNLKAEQDLFGLGLQALYITQGEQGCRLVTKEANYHIGTVEVERIEDPTGAGDAFVGATMSGILLGYDFEAAGRIGNVVGSFVVERKGSQTNLPDWKGMKERYEQKFGSIPTRLSEIL